MPHGPGKYDDLCSEAKAKAQATGAILLIINGSKGYGFEVQAPIDVHLRLPTLLRDMAQQIEDDLPKPVREAPTGAPTGEWAAVPEGRPLMEPTYVWHRLFIGRHLIWIDPRAGHCDRGRYAANYDGPFFIDAADGFPRYYMDLETAKREMKAWLEWRIQCESMR